MRRFRQPSFVGTRYPDGESGTNQLDAARQSVQFPASAKRTFFSGHWIGAQITFQSNRKLDVVTDRFATRSRMRLRQRSYLSLTSPFTATLGRAARGSGAFGLA